MFNRNKPKRIKNRLFSAEFPPGFKKSLAGGFADLVASEPYDKTFYPVSIFIRLLLREQIDAIPGKDFLEKYRSWVFRSGDVPVINSAIVDLEDYQGVSLLLNKGQPMLFGAGGVITKPEDVPAEQRIAVESLRYCLETKTTTDFYFEVTIDHDSRHSERVRTIRDELLANIEVFPETTTENYRQLEAKEIADDSTFISELQEKEKEKENQNRQYENDVKHIMAALIQKYGLSDVGDLSDFDVEPIPAKILVNGALCDIHFDFSEETAIRQIGIEADRVLAQVDAIDQGSKQAIVDQMLNIYNSSWTDKDLGRHPLSEKQFLEELTSPFISIYSDTTNFDYSTKSDLFAGHGLSAEYAQSSDLKTPTDVSML